MTAIRRLFAALSFFLVALGAPVRAEEAVDVLLRASGLWKQLELVMLSTQDGLAKAQAQEHGLPPERFLELQEAAAVAFDVGRLRARMRERLLEALPAADMEATVAWLETPIGRKATLLEERASTMEVHIEREGRGEAMDALLEDPKRRSRIERLADATDATGATLAVGKEVMKAVVEGVALATGVTAGDLERLRQAVEEQQASLEPAVRAETLRSMAHTYEDLSNAELDAYAAFAEGDLGQRYHAAVNEGLVGVLAQAAREFGTRLVGGPKVSG